MSITSGVLHEQRLVTVMLPVDYEGSNERYPVLYLLDAETRLDDLAPVILEMSVNGTIPHLICVGVHNTDRMRDMSPTAVERRATSGGALEFLRFVEEELVPYVDRRYRTNGVRLLYGHSLAGTFVVHAVLSAPDVFSAGIATSPNLAWDNDAIHDVARRLLREHRFEDNYLYLGIGTRDPLRYIESLQRFSGLLGENAPVGLGWKLDVFQGEDHATMPVAGLPKGLKEVCCRNRAPSGGTGSLE